MNVEVYSDVVCPWCYIGDRRFAAALERYDAADDVEVVFRPYQLDPDAPRSAVPLGTYLEGRYGARAAGMMERVGEAAAAEGITIHWDEALAANTLTAHRLLELARSERGPEAQRQLAEALFALHFTRGGDVSDPGALADLAVEVGMDRERVRRHLASDAGVREVQERIEAARRLGIQAVPTFLFDGRWAVQGAQPTAVFLRALEEAAGG